MRKKGDFNNTTINLLIIREIFMVINNSMVTNDEFYIQLLGVTDKRNVRKADRKKEAYRASDIFANFINRGTLKVSKYKDQFVKNGFSASFFEDGSASLIIAPQECIDNIKIYLQDPRLMKIQQFREKYIIPYIFEYKNENGTLIIDCIKKIIDEIKYNKIKKDEKIISNVLNYVTNLSSTTALSQKQIKKFYNDLGKSYNKDNGSVEYITLPKSETVNNHKIFLKADNDRIKQTLLLIRETYAMLAEIDNNVNAMNNFYSFLGCTENEYDDYIRYGNIPTRELVSKFQIFKFPASLFRGDLPCEIDITSLGRQLNNNCNIDDANDIRSFRNALRLNLFYRIEKRNIPFFMAVYSMYNSPFEEVFNMVNLELAKENSFPKI